MKTPLSFVIDMTCECCCDNDINIIECYSCDFKVCEICIRKYIDMKHEFILPRCMSCNVEWDNVDVFSKKFIRGFLNHNVSKKLVRIEKNLISMYDIEKSKRLHIKREHMKVHRDNIQRIRINTHRLKEEARMRRCAIQGLDPAKGYYLGYDMYRTIKYLEKDEYDDYVNGNRELEDLRYSLRIKLNNVRIHHGGGVERRINCPKGCETFMRILYQSDYQCVICNAMVCSKCLGEIRTEKQHVCRDENAISVSFVKKHTKCCPNCTSPILKIDGCNQMWCTICRISFSWKSGKKIGYKVMHNPHFFDHMREKGIHVPRNALDAPCGGLPPYPYAYPSPSNANANANASKDIYDNVVKIRGTVLPRMQKKIDKQDKNDDLRLKFLVGDISEHKLERLLYRRFYENKFNIDIYPILETYCVVLEEAFRNRDSHENIRLSHECIKRELDRIYKKHRKKNIVK